MPADPGDEGGLVAREYVLKKSPFTVRRRVRWSECDPAGVVYNGNYPEYLSSAIDLFKDHLEIAGYLRPDRAYHTPAKALSLVYMSPLWPDDVFDIVLFAGEVRTRTSEVLAEARRVDDERPVFAGRLTSIYVSAEDRRQAVTVPDRVRKIYATYRDDNPPPTSLVQAFNR